VVGVGVMGAAVLHRLAARGVAALGIEQFQIGHTHGSSHGRSRVIRKAYYEDPRYVPLLERAYVLWGELEASSGETLLVRTGCLHLGPRDHEGMAGVLASVGQHGLAHELLDAAEVRRRYPQFRLADGDVGVFESDGGILAPERCVVAQVAAARGLGAQIVEGERVVDVLVEGDSVVVETDRALHVAGAAVLTQGSWLGRGMPVTVERQVQLWFEARSDAFAIGRFPVFMHFAGDQIFYGLPPFGLPALKLCRHHGGPTVHPDTVGRDVTAGDEEHVRAWAREHLPEASGARLLDAKVCLYTNTADANFLIGPVPGEERLFVAGGFSGHGFKFAPVVGEIIADLVIRGRTLHDIRLFNPGRFEG